MRWTDGTDVKGVTLFRFEDDETVVIASGQTESAAVDARSSSLYGAMLPDTFTGTTLTFLVSNVQDGTYRALANDSGNISRTVAQGKAYALPEELAPYPWFKIKSGSSEAADRSLTVTKLR